MRSLPAGSIVRIAVRRVPNRSPRPGSRHADGRLHEAELRWPAPRALAGPSEPTRLETVGRVRRATADLAKRAAIELAARRRWTVDATRLRWHDRTLSEQETDQAADVAELESQSEAERRKPRVTGLTSLEAISSGKPFRRPGWSTWVFMNRLGSWCAVAGEHLKYAPLDPEHWPPNPYAVIRSDLFAQDWEIQ